MDEMLSMDFGVYQIIEQKILIAQNMSIASEIN
jgi:hypothetical protein